MGDLVQFRRCKVCGKMAALQDEACARCRDCHGTKAGIVIEEARRDPDLARKMMEKAVAMYGPDAGERFAEMFGLKGSR